MGAAFGGCSVNDPNDTLRKLCTGSGPPNLGDAVDPDRSFVWGPGVPGTDPDIFFVSLQGKGVPGANLLCQAGESAILLGRLELTDLNLLCQAGESAILLGRLELTDLPPGTAPTLTLSGLAGLTLEALVDPNGVAVAREDIELVSRSGPLSGSLSGARFGALSGVFDPNAPNVTLRLLPADDDPGGERAGRSFSSRRSRSTASASVSWAPRVLGPRR
jgi:hypothetical protein